MSSNLAELKSSVLQNLRDERVTRAGVFMHQIRDQFGQAIIDEDPELKDVQRRIDSIERFLALLEDKNWATHIDDGENVKIKYKPRENSNMYDFLMEGTINAPLLNIISVINEIDLFTTWIPRYTIPFKIGLRESRKTHQIGQIDQLVYFVADAPWPISDRDMHLLINASDDIESNNRIVITMKSYEPSQHPEYPQDVPQPNSGVVRMFLDGGIVIEPRSPTSSYLRLAWNVDPKLNTPSWLLNFVTKTILKTAFEELRNACMKASDGEYKARREANPQMYDEFVGERLKLVGMYYDENNQAFKNIGHITDDNKKISPE